STTTRAEAATGGGRSPAGSPTGGPARPAGRGRPSPPGQELEPVPPRVVGVETARSRKPAVPAQLEPVRTGSSCAGTAGFRERAVSTPTTRGGTGSSS